MNGSGTIYALIPGDVDPRNPSFIVKQQKVGSCTNMETAAIKVKESCGIFGSKGNAFLERKL